MQQNLHIYEGGCTKDKKQQHYTVTTGMILQWDEQNHLTLVLYGLAFVSLERAKLHCSEPSAVYLFVLQANWLRQSCSNQGGR